MVKKITLFLLTVLVCLASEAASKHKFTLVIDAGHGGKDAGACANGVKEKNINLSVALAFGNYVENNCSDVKVIYTRKTDVFIPLHERAHLANKNNANSMPGKKPKQLAGLETYTMGMRRSDEKLSVAQRENEVVLKEDNYKEHYVGYDPKSPESIIIFDFMNEQNMAKSVELARLIQTNVSSTAGRPNIGVKQDAFLVLRETAMPACLVELGYVTTRSEATTLTSKKKVLQMAQGLYQAFVTYKRSHAKGNVAVPDRPSDNIKPVRQSDRTDTDSSLVEENEEPAEQSETTADQSQSSGTLIFKVQILTSDQNLKAGDRRLKGQKKVDRYKEGKIWKYTVGCSENYQEILALRRKLSKDFPQAFVIAFKDGEKTDVNKAREEYQRKQKANKKKNR